MDDVEMKIRNVSSSRGTAELSRCVLTRLNRAGLGLGSEVNNQGARGVLGSGGVVLGLKIGATATPLSSMYLCLGCGSSEESEVEPDRIRRMEG
jgi:L,D-peptidoglycan transpeptidase YkuD (ErfK/YbiS/YcfS/YnhG family)